MAVQAPERVTPEERTQASQPFYQQYKELTGPDYLEDIRRRRQERLKNVARGTAQAIQQGKQPSQFAGIAGQAQAEARQAQVQEEAGEAGQALQAQQMGTQQNLAQRQQAAQNWQSKLAYDQERMAGEIANRAFDMGMDARQLIFAQNEALADKAFNQLYEDFQAGRVTKREISALQRRTKEDATRMKQSADQMLADALGKFNADVAAGNMEAAKMRLNEAIAAQKAAMKRAATASNIAGLFTAAVKIGTSGVFG